VSGVLARSTKFLLVLLFALSAAPSALAQQQQAPPAIGYVFPAGGRQGTTVQVKVGGQRLLQVDKAYLSHGGVQATVLETARPLNNKEVMELRKTLQELRDKTPKTADILKEMTAIAETVTLEIKIAPDAAPGRHELRLGSPAGLSNPLVFCVGQLPEITRTRTEQNFTLKQFATLKAGSQAAPPAPEMTLALPTVVNGQIMPGEADRYRFPAKKGQHLIVAVSARDLIPYLADAVPGWFQAAVTLSDSAGNELAAEDHYEFHPDPALHVCIPADGDYVIEIHDSIYRGREDFIYRLMVGELPFVTGIFPLGGRTGEQTAVELKGWNLPVATLTQNNRDLPPGLYPLGWPAGNLASAPRHFAVGVLPECLDLGTNATVAAAQPVTLPVTINGCITKPRQWHIYRFDARAGDRIVAEVYARRLDSPLASVLRLTDSANCQLALNEGHDDLGAGLLTDQADSLLQATLPAAGSYYLWLGDLLGAAGPDYAYRLRLGPPQPDFQLRVVPSTLNVRGGGTVPLTVYALRQDGCSEEIALSLKGAPGGFHLDGALLPAGQDKVQLTLTVPAVATEEPLAVSLEGRALIKSRGEVVRDAVPADDRMQAFAYRHLVPADELNVFVSSRFLQARNRPTVSSPLPIRIPAGGSAEIRLNIPGQILLANDLELELNDPPDGLTLQKLSTAVGVTTAVVKADAAKCKAGLKGNLVINAYVMRTPPAPPTSAASAAPATAAPAVPAAKPARTLRVPLGTLPAMPFEVLAR
jgi:hypothetical protein